MADTPRTCPSANEDSEPVISPSEAYSIRCDREYFL